MEQATVLVRFEVSLRGLAEGEEVRITGGSASLGHWDTHNSVCLKKCTGEENVWSAECVVPANTVVEYRYLVTACSQGEELRIVSWEASPQPRVCSFTHGQESTVRDEYGVNQDGSMVIEEGWLLDYSELQVHLGTRGPALALDGMKQDYLIRTQAFSTSQVMESSAVKTKLCDRTTGECITVLDGLCPYNQDRNIVGFSCQAVNFTHTGLNIDFYESASERVGRASLHPHQLSQEGRGFLTLTVFSEQLEPIGTLSLGYLVIEPMRGVSFSTQTSHCRHWLHQCMLHIGHRGLGDSHHTDFKASLPENTVASLTAAGNHGADYVEFDVQLTKDLVPVLYHNFTLNVSQDGEPLMMELKDLTLSQLHSPQFQWSSSPELELFSTLQKVFDEVPEDVGFNVEIKYPLPEVADDGTLRENWSCFPVNQFADTLLSVIKSHARNRRIIFSCFSPDMCTVLRRKQPVYPVMFLTADLNPRYLDPQDLRAHKLSDAVMFAKEQQLLGVVCDSWALLERPAAVGVVKGSGLVLITWGNTNNSPESITAQESSGFHGVIYDCIDKLHPKNQK